MSSNPFALSAIQSQPEDTQQDNPFSLRSIEKSQGVALREKLNEATTWNPDSAAEAARLAKRYPAPTDTVYRNLDSVKRRAAVDDAQAALTAAPDLAARMRENPDLARQAHDDVGVLSEISQAIRNIGGAALSGLQRGSEGVLGAVQAPFDLGAQAIDPLVGTILPTNPLRATAQGLSAWRQRIKAMAEGNMPKGEGNLEQGFYSGISSLSTNLAALPLAMLNPTAGLAAMVAPVGGQGYGQARDQGVAPLLAAQFGMSQAAIEYATEKIPVQRLIGDVRAGTGIVKTLLKQMALEVPGEQVATVFQDLNEWALLPENADKTFADYLAARPDAAIQTLVATVVGTGGNVAVVKGIDAAMRRLEGQDKGIADGEALKEALRIAGQSKLLERNPEAFREALDAMAGDAEVRFDARTLLEQSSPDALVKALPSLADQLAEAQASGGEVRVPVSEFIAGVVGTPLEQSLREHARLGENEMSQAEAKDAASKAEQFLQQEAERVIQQAQDQAAMRQSQEVVKQGVLDQLNTVGRFSPQVNEAYATFSAAFYTTMAGRMGITPEEMAAKYPLRIFGQTPGAPGSQTEVMDQPRPFEQASAQPVMSTSVTDSQGGQYAVSVSRQVFGSGQVNPNAVLVELRDPATGERRGFIDFSIRGDGVLTAENTKVAPDFQKRGLAAAMYQAARDAGFDIAPGRVQTDQGLGMVEALQRKGVINKPADGPRFRAGDLELQQSTDGFDRWVGDATRVDIGDAHKFKDGEPVVVAALHGTTGDFTTFDRSMANIESDLGGGFYFTNNPEDLGNNYAGMGPDLTNKIQAEAEMLESNDDLDSAEAMTIARDKWMANEGLSMPVWVKFDNPVVLGGQRETFLSYEEAFDEETEEYGESTGKLVEVLDALREVASDERYGDFDVEKTIADVMERAMDSGGLTAREFIEVAKLSEGLVYATDYENDRGALASTEILRKAFEGAGFDGFVDTTVDEKFGSQSEGQRKYGKGMKGMDESTVHFIAFQSNQIKSRLGNSGAFDPNDPDILKQGPRGTFNPRTLELALNPNADLSTFLHESGHFFLEVMSDLASQPNAPAGVVEDMGVLLKWFGITGDESVGGADSGVPLGQGGAGVELDRWYGAESTLRNADGSPMVLYHGTNKRAAASIQRDGKIKRGTYGAMGAAVYLGDSAEASAGYDDGAMLRVYARGKYLTNMQWTDYVQKHGWSGAEAAARADGWAGVYDAMFENAVAVWDPSNIKSVDAKGFTEGGSMFAQGDTLTGAAQPVTPKRTPLETWQSMTLDQKRPYHERFAESIEQYLMEGKAPSLELQPVFHRFRSWLLRVYKSVKEFLAGRGVAPAGGETLGQGGAQTDSEAFERWFGDSKVVDDQGRPLVVYHGTTADFTIFDPKRKVEGSFGKGFYFTDKVETADKFGARGDYYIALQNPATMKDGLAVAFDTKKLMRRGFDGIIVESKLSGERTVVAFSPNQIKSATGNDGSFDSNDPSILSQGAPNPSQIQLSDEVRQVFDRMLASEEQIRQAEEVAGMLPDETATADAIDKLTARSLRDMKWLANARSKAIKALQKQAAALRKEVKAEVTAEVNAMPEFLAKDALVKAEKEYEADPTSADFNAAVIADSYGFASVESMYRAIDAVGKKADVIEGMTDQRMLERHGDLIDQRAIEEAANAAVHNDARAKVLATELKAQADLLGTRSPKTVAPDLPDTKAVGPDGKPMLVYHGTDQEFDTFASGMFTSTRGRAENYALGSKGRVLETYLNITNPMPWRDSFGKSPDEIAAAGFDGTIQFGDDGSIMRAVVVDPSQIVPPVPATNAAGKPITINALQRAAQLFAENVVARTPLKNLKRAAWDHTAAERRAAKAWQEATAAGKTQEAVQAKQDQVLNNAAAKAALDAQQEVVKIRDFFARIVKGNDEKTVERGRDPDVVNAARAILSAYGVQSPASKNALAYLETVKTNDPAMYAAIEPAVSAALLNPRPLDTLTIGELRALRDELDSLWHLSKRSRQMEVDGNLMDIEDAVAELQTRLQDVPPVIPGELSAMTPKEQAGRMLQFAVAITRRVEAWAEALDGKYGGPFTRLVFGPVKAAADRYRSDRIEYRRKFVALLDNVSPTMRRGLIEAPELGYVFGKGHNGVGMAELLHAVLHTGNASNKRKLLLGRGWATELADGTLDTTKWDTFLKRMTDTGVLTKAHYDFAQGVWDLLEGTKALAQKAHRDVFGRYFAEVTAEPFNTPFGSYRGGYVPAQADTRIVTDAALRDLANQENENMAFAFPTTNKGFTKARVEYNRPLVLDLRTIAQHLDKVLLFSHMEPAVRDVRKALMAKGVSQALSRIQPAAYEGMLTPWMNRAAKQIVETPVLGDGKIGRIASAVRARAGMALMFGNVSNTLQQITGLSSALVKVSAGSMMNATAAYIAGPKKMAERVATASPYMAERIQNEVSIINETMNEILLDPSVYERAQVWTQKHAYFLQSAFDNVISPIVWTGAYNDALKRGMTESEAVKFADSTIRQTQGSTMPEDVSRIETGPAFVRLFSQFIGYFNMVANTNATALMNIAGEVGLKKGAGRALGVVFAGLLMPIWVAEFIAQAMRGGPDDEDKDGWWIDDWLAAVFGFGTIKGIAGAIPGAGQVGQLIVNRFNDQPADDRMSLSPAVSVIESAAGAPASVYKAIVDDASKQKAVRDVASLVTVATGLPASFVARSVGYAAGVADDRIEPTGPIDAARGVISGVASPESKQR